MRQERRFTLLELLVAVGIMVVLGTSLMIILRGGLSTWLTGEARRESSQVAQVIFETLREDLQSATIYRQRLGKSGPVETRLLCDFDQVTSREGSAPAVVYRQRLFLTRTIRDESENPITGVAGTTLNATGRVDLHYDREEALDGNLRATGGLMEVGYVLGGRDPRVLYRMVRSPVGGDLSLFDYDRLPASRADPPRDAIVEAFRERLTGLEAIKSVGRVGSRVIIYGTGALPDTELMAVLAEQDWFKAFDEVLASQDMSLSIEDVGSDEALAAAVMDARCQTWGSALAGDVLFLGFEFWHQYTVGWEAPARRFEGRREHGPLSYWDSTRGILRAPTEDGEFGLFKSTASRDDATDDVLPERVRVTLVLAEPPKAGSESALDADIGATDERIPIKFPGRAPPGPAYVLVGSEWIRYSDIEGSSLVVDIDGRGARGTTALPHLAESSAIFGRTFQTIIELPTATEDWSD